MASLSLPSNPHEIGDASHVTDHNLIVSNLSVLVGAVVNVQTYGAVGDGTTDDAAAFNAALAACAVGGTVFVPPAPGGYYLVASTIVVPSFKTLAGTHGIGNIVANAGTGCVIRQANNANLNAVIASWNWYNNVATVDSCIEIRDITIDGNYSNQTSGTGYGIAHSSWRGRVHDCWVLRTRSSGICITNKSSNGTGMAGSLVETYTYQNIVAFAQSHAIQTLEASSETGLITDGFMLHNLVQAPTGDAIHINDGGGWDIDGNHVYGYNANGIYVSGPWDCKIINNYIEVPGSGAVSGAIATGINVVMPNAGSSTIISNNHVRLDTAPVAGVTYRGFYLATTGASATWNFSLTGNVVHGYTTAPYGTGIVLSSYSGSLFRMGEAGNIVDSNVETATAQSGNVTIKTSAFTTS